MFASQTIQSPRSNSAVRRMGALLIVGAMSLLLGACAHNAGNAPAVQWQFNSSDAGSAGPSMYAVDSEPLADVTVQDSAVEAPRAEASEQQRRYARVRSWRRWLVEQLLRLSWRPRPHHRQGFHAALIRNPLELLRHVTVACAAPILRRLII